MNKAQQLYIAINEMMLKIGIDGEISTRDREADAVMSALYELDGGIYNEKIDKNIFSESACKNTG